MRICSLLEPEAPLLRRCTPCTAVCVSAAPYRKRWQRNERTPSPREIEKLPWLAIAQPAKSKEKVNDGRSVVATLINFIDVSD